MNNRQIAVEAADSMDEAQLLLPYSRFQTYEQTKSKVISIIEAAIEKATEERTQKAYNDGWDAGQHNANLTSAKRCDPWHPASEPPKPEDFEPTEWIHVYCKAFPELCTTFRRFSDHGLEGSTHWRRITPPK